jgi:hypothetical protein
VIFLEQSKTETAGLEALDRNLKFDEKKTVEDNMDYICKQLNLVSLELAAADSTADLAQAEKTIVSKAIPGVPAFYVL